MIPMETSKEEWGIVLDYLPNGYSDDRRPSHLKTPVVQALGKSHLVLLELVPKKGVVLQPHELVYIGEGKRDKIHHIVGKLAYTKLSSTASSEVEFIIKEMITENEKQFLDFFNTARPLTTRMHSLELLPGLGKKRMWEILEEREKEPFKSFEELRKRVKLMPDPKGIIMKRILKEMEGNEKHYFFVKG
jgi:putative nucleotide binding protein